MLGDARSNRYKAAIDILIADKNIDSLIVVLTPQSMTEFDLTAQAIISAKKKLKTDSSEFSWRKIGGK